MKIFIFHIFKGKEQNKDKKAEIIARLIFSTVENPLSLFLL